MIKGDKVGGGDVAGIETGSPLLRGFLGKGIEHGFLHAAVSKGAWEAGCVEGGLDLLGERFGRGGAVGGGDGGVDDEVCIARSGGFVDGVKTNDVREHHANGLAMDDIEVGG